MSTHHALGSLLLQPQVLKRAKAIPDQHAIIDELTALAHRLLLNPQQAQALVPAVNQAIDQCVAQLRQQVEPRLSAALTELQGIAQPFVSGVTTIVNGSGSLTTVGEITAMIGHALDGVIALVQSVSAERITALVNQLKHLLTQTLGLTVEGLKQLLRDFLRHLRERLLAVTTPPDALSLRLACAAVIARVQREYLHQLPDLPLDTTHMVAAIMGGLQAISFDKIRAAIEATLEKVRTVLGVSTALVDLVKPSVFGGGSIGSAAVREPMTGDTYCWYASWLFRTRGVNGEKESPGYSFLPGCPTNEVWLSADKTQLILRRVGDVDVVLHENPAGIVNWYDAPLFSSTAGPVSFTFKHVSPASMEQWTRIFWMLGTTAKGTLHTVGVIRGKKELGSNLPQLVWQLANFISGGAAGAPFSSYLTAASGLGLAGQWLFNLIPVLSFVGGTFEGMQTGATAGSRLKFWITLALSDLVNVMTYNGIPEQAQDALLSFLTLLNYDGPNSAPASGDDLRPRNLDSARIYGALAGFGAVYLFMWLAPRKHYGLPAPITGSGWPYLYWGLGFVPAFAGHLLGTMLGWGFAGGAIYWKGYKGDLGASFVSHAINVLMLWYSVKEGDAQSGECYHGEGSFSGYASQDTSPYKLPFKPGKPIFVGQANQGLFSHNAFQDTAQVYAYDFGMDEGDEIVAARAGTVVDYFDWVADNTRPSTTAEYQVGKALAQASGFLKAGQTDWTGWNFIIVRHDAVNNDHDLDLKAANGQPTVVTTYAVYGHGRQNSVRDAFGARSTPVAAANIIGTAVAQGDVIMKAGHTGMSFHNHLHMQVQVRDPVHLTAHVNEDQLKHYTIPFVFQGVRNVIGKDGVLKACTWYESDNGALP